MPLPMRSQSPDGCPSTPSCSPRVLDALVAKVRQHVGADYSGPRRSELVRLLGLAGVEEGATNIPDWLTQLAFADWQEEQVQRLIPFLTVGETYFRRDSDVFTWLQQRFLPQLMTQRRVAQLYRLRCWSAGCCSGEEAYSLLFLLDELWAAEPEPWELELHGTDVNRCFLASATEGIYGQNAFRLTDERFRQRHFEPVDRRWRVKPRWRNRIHFTELNLASESLPQAPRGLINCDLILCRNVLMYFVPEQAAAILRRLVHCLSDEGLLLISAVEAGIATQAGLSGEWIASNYGLRRNALMPVRPPLAPTLARDQVLANVAPARRQQVFTPLPPLEPVARPVHRPATPTPVPARQWQAALAAYSAGRQVETQRALLDYLALPVLPRSDQFQACLLMARSQADQHAFGDANAWLERALEIDRTDAHAYWLQALLLQQRNDTSAARNAIQKALYLEPDFVMANFLHAQLLLKGGQTKRAAKALAICDELLARQDAGAIVPDSDGLSVAQLKNLCHYLKTEAMRCRPH